MANEFFSAAKAAVWVQPDGPNTSVYYLGCHDVGDISEPGGEISSRYCPDPTAPGKWIPVLQTQSIPDSPTFSITTYIGKTADWLEKLDGPANFYIHSLEAGNRNIFTNYARGVGIRSCRINNRTESNLASRESDDGSEQSFEFTAEAVFRYYDTTVSRLTTTEANDLTDLCFLGLEWEAGSMGAKREKDDIAFISCAAGTGAAANVLRTTNKGATWTATGADPFDTDEDIQGIVCFPTTGTTYRVLCARGTTDAAAPAEVAYSDDAGETWSTVDVGSTNAEFVQHQGALFMLDYSHIWVGLDSGDIYFSEDGGLTWTDQGSPTAEGINYIHMYDEDFGVAAADANVILRTIDGGEHWTAVVAPAAKSGVAAKSCICVDGWSLFVGYEDGDIYYSFDGGVTWAARSYAKPSDAATVTNINDFDMISELEVGFSAMYTTAGGDEYPVFYRTVNGGTNWEPLTYDEDFDAGTTGMNALEMISTNKIYAVGQVATATGMILLASV